MFTFLCSVKGKGNEVLRGKKNFVWYATVVLENHILDFVHPFH
jgi:hypothetical protein